MLFVLILVPGHAGVASAHGSGTETSPLPISCTVSASVHVELLPTSKLSFGNVARSESNDAEINISVKATKGESYRIKIDGGANGGTTGNNNRSMKEDAGSATLPYSLFTDSGRTTNWNVDTEYPTSGITSVSGFSATVTPVYGRVGPIDANQNIGGYTDTPVLVTVTIF